MAETSLTCLTYNIHCAQGADGRHDPARILAVLREANADVVALQEVENNEAAADAFVLRLEMLGYTTVLYGQTMLRDRAQYGNVLLTRLPCRHVARLNISLPGREPRGGVAAVIESPLGLCAVVATHLGLNRRERKFQAALLMRHFDERARAGVEDQILMGDLNEWRRGGALRGFRERFLQDLPPATFPTRRPFLCLDRIMTTPHLRCNYRRLVTSDTRLASDHYPLLATIHREAG